MKLKSPRGQWVKQIVDFYAIQAATSDIANGSSILYTANWITYHVDLSHTDLYSTPVYDITIINTCVEMWDAERCITKMFPET